ncbi:DUF3515 domain-containing protein [Streptomyces sanyensis]|uniref:DUF3515 domain-containing protein n=1 Tax=Streptomyces sanyensis TaxID=568869 RepID=UPI003D781D67
MAGDVFAPPAPSRSPDRRSRAGRRGGLRRRRSRLRRRSQPPADEAVLCRALHDALPRSVAGQERRDPEPASELTAGWGDAAIVLRCGVPRPERMSDPQAQGIEVDGVGWMLEEREEGPRFTTTYRRTYVEVTLDRRYLHDASPLTDLAGPVAEAVPSAL